MVLVDTLLGSLSIKGNPPIFNYSKESRESLWLHLHDRGADELFFVTPKEVDDAMQEADGVCGSEEEGGGQDPQGQAGEGEEGSP